ncbi:hypothetical protein ACHAL6_08880 [Proteiniclasticum sp. C24MP]|uniref:hypothetical protein n=1 Tax=Proteiniclasticum sp. C24MP TaxID=3374101 RepID=UPI00375433CE
MATFSDYSRKVKKQVKPVLGLTSPFLLGRGSVFLQPDGSSWSSIRKGTSTDLSDLLDKRVVIAKIIVFKNIAAQKNVSISSFLAAFKILWGVVI